MSPAEITRSVIAKTAEKHGLEYADMLKQDRRLHIVRARQEAWFLLLTERGLSYPAIGRATGHDHTTVIHGVQSYCKRVGIDYARMRFDMRHPFLLRAETFEAYGQAMGMAA